MPRPSGPRARGACAHRRALSACEAWSTGMFGRVSAASASLRNRPYFQPQPWRPAPYPSSSLQSSVLALHHHRMYLSDHATRTALLERLRCDRLPLASPHGGALPGVRRRAESARRPVCIRGQSRRGCLHPPAAGRTGPIRLGFGRRSGASASRGQANSKTETPGQERARRRARRSPRAARRDRSRPSLGLL